jgi:hypothetical protein
MRTDYTFTKIGTLRVICFFLPLIFIPRAWQHHSLRPRQSGNTVSCHVLLPLSSLMHKEGHDHDVLERAYRLPSLNSFHVGFSSVSMNKLFPRSHSSPRPYNNTTHHHIHFFQHDFFVVIIHRINIAILNLSIEYRRTTLQSNSSYRSREEDIETGRPKQ